MNRETLNSNKIQEFLSYYSNNQDLEQIIDESNYDSYVIRCKNGSKIHIKKKNRGKFTDSANRSGMGVQEFASHVLSNKDKYSATQIKRANFARNASKWKHKG